MTKRTKYRIKPDRVITSTLNKSVAAILGNDVSSPAVSLQKGLPRHPRCLDRVKSIIEKDPFDCVSCDLMTEIVERSSNSRLAPARVVAGHQEYQLLDAGFGPRATWPSVLAPVVFLRDQLSVPTKQSIWCHQGTDLDKPSSTDRFGLDGESAAWSIGESQTFSAQLLAQRSVFLLEIFNHVLLVPIDPAPEDQHQKLESQSVH